MDDSNEYELQDIWDFSKNMLFWVYDALAPVER